MTCKINELDNKHQLDAFSICSICGEYIPPSLIIYDKKNPHEMLRYITSLQEVIRRFSRKIYRLENKHNQTGMSLKDLPTTEEIVEKGFIVKHFSTEKILVIWFIKNGRVYNKSIRFEVNPTKKDFENLLDVENV